MTFLSESNGNWREPQERPAQERHTKSPIQFSILNKDLGDMRGILTGEPVFGKNRPLANCSGTWDEAT